MDIGGKDNTIMADSGDWVAFDSFFDGNAKANPSDWVAFDSVRNFQSDPPPRSSADEEQSNPVSQNQRDVTQPQLPEPQEEENAHTEVPPDPKQQSLDPYSDVDLKRTVSAERTGSALTAPTLPETPPRRPMKTSIQQQEDTSPQAPPDPEPSFHPYNDTQYEPAALKKTVSAERTGSALTAQTLPETPPRRQTTHVVAYGESIPMGDMVAKKLSSDTDSNSHDPTYDPEQPDTSDKGKAMPAAAPKPSRRNCTFCFLLAFLLIAVAGALGFIVYIQLFHEVGLETKSPTTEPSASPTEAPSSMPTSLPSSKPTPDSASPTISASPSTPAPTTRPPTSPPSRSPSSVPSASPTTSHPTFTPSLNPTSVGENLHDLIAKVTDGNTIQAIDTPGTPQQLAYEWVINDPAYFYFKKRRIVQRFTMAVLYYSVVGSEASIEAMSSWLDYDTNECTWFMSWYENRFPCGSDDVFRTLALRNVELTGQIPSELALLTKLNTLVLSDNILTGSLPKEFGQWASLVNLDVHSNFITGTIPEWTNVPSLQEMNLASNRLVGNVPASIVNLNITSLDLAENRIQGLIPPALCQTAAQQSQIKLMTVDCDKVTCFCCTQCGVSQHRVPTLTPFTPPPTRSPTTSPSSVPTPNTCFSNVQTSKRCYKVGEPVDISFSNCNPRPGDWIGLYNAENPMQLLLDPLLWHRTCGSKFCSESPKHGSSILDESAEGQVFWPLPRGNYKVYLIRNGSRFPYQPVVGSEQIRVAQSICPD